MNTETLQITVLNKRSLSQPLPGIYREYVGRPSPLGNPFVLKGESARQEVVDRYDSWLRGKWAKDPVITRELCRLLKIAKRQPLELVCWCAPKACHADKIRDLLLELNT
jgi:hypothetical protein